MPPTGYVPIKSVHVRHWGQLVGAAAVIVLTASVVLSLLQNEHLDWWVFLANITSDDVLHGLVVTIQLSVISMALGIVFGTLVAMMRMSSNRFLSTMAALYVWFFRGIPLIVLVMVWGNFAILAPQLGIGVPFTDVMFVEVPTNSVLTTFVAACLALSLHETSYMAEIVRGGILSVNSGQREAAAALGLTGGMTMTRVILPQALRVIIPPTGNQFITLIKSSSLVSVIAGGELMTAVSDIAASNFRILELLFVACFWYLVLVTVLSVAQRFFERRLSTGFRR